ncbi:TPA: hypothetical protein QDB46_005754 [Burkholderia multivorans]|nr:hypothetical protein [Burkholderia multivorans]HDR9296263.1 hypothetical protein [Burkholderia multivorans]HDR9301981.1 hypothetical protein [Burkholderia multivorans]HDR9307712.1 hypothetical protein [Burkholderia multivorans]HDR9313449.1 hypothetical protein [Burkholderia multivorans]
MATPISRKKAPSAEEKRRWNMMTRYGMTPSQYDDLLKNQNGLCALCGGLMERPVIDHCHQTGRVRGILCHPCNIKLPAVEDMGWVMLAWAYLEGDS